MPPAIPWDTVPFAKTQDHAVALLQRFKECAGEEIALELLDGQQEEMYWEYVQRSQAHEALQGDGDRMRADDQDALKDTGEGKPRRCVTY